MSNEAPKFRGHEEAKRAARHRLRDLEREIAAHRTRAHLARLEAEYEDSVAEVLSRALRRRPNSHSNERAGAPHVDSLPLPIANPPESAEAALDIDSTAPADSVSRRLAVRSKNIATERAEENEAATVLSIMPSRSKTLRRSRTPAPAGPGLRPRSAKNSQNAAFRSTARPIVVSLAVHAVGLFIFLTLGFATLVQPNVPLFAGPPEPSDESPERLDEVEIESAKFDDAELQNVVSEDDDFNIADNLMSEFEPAQLGAGSQPLGDMGQLDALPGELGTLMSGAGSPSSGSPGGEPGSAVFFGTRSKGNRFVFVVDNSSSMRDGRLDAAIAELVRSVESLSPRQSFYVIFVSDQPYPMFYPQPATDLLPATPQNKKRLSEWLPKALLASGKNREIIKAMDLAASLRPQAVYLLWDGDMRYSEKVRLEVMTHLTRPNQWNFAIHTLGMGVTSLDAEYNLTAVAQAHGGTYRRVDVPAGRGR
jgi:hypothetical protein